MIEVEPRKDGVGVLAYAPGRNYPTLRQFTIFLENRVGRLLEVVRRFEASRVRIVALSINDSTECAFLRLLLSHPEQGPDENAARPQHSGNGS